MDIIKCIVAKIEKNIKSSYLNAVFVMASCMNGLSFIVLPMTNRNNIKALIINKDLPNKSLSKCSRAVSDKM